MEKSLYAFACCNDFKLGLYVCVDGNSKENRSGAESHCMHVRAAMIVHIAKNAL